MGLWQNPGINPAASADDVDSIGVQEKIRVMEPFPLRRRFPPFRPDEIFLVGFRWQMAQYMVASQKQNRDGSGLELDAVYFVVVAELHVASPESHSFD